MKQGRTGKYERHGGGGARNDGGDREDGGGDVDRTMRTIGRPD